MSLILGQIHYWLYNKIKWAEKMEQDILQWAKTKDLPADQWARETADKYGQPVGNKKLDDEIDPNNIHGWLQGTIESAELRQGYIITSILAVNPEFKKELVTLFESQGQLAAKEHGQEITTPEEAFKALNDFILEGMPCDRVNEVISSDELKYSWKTLTCVHKSYWDRVEGDISIFYILRDAWVKAFIESLAPNFKYTKTEESVHEIIKQ